MKNVIIVYGNIASGKSTVCRALAAIMGWPVVSLDDHRREVFAKYELNQRALEQKAYRACLDDLLSWENVIFETTAVTKFFSRAIVQLQSHQYRQFRVYLYCPIPVAIKQYYQRTEKGHFQAPFAWGTKDIELSIQYFDRTQRQLPKHLTIHSNKYPAAEIARKIVKKL